MITAPKTERKKIIRNSGDFTFQNSKCPSKTLTDALASFVSLLYLRGELRVFAAFAVSTFLLHLFRCLLLPPSFSFSFRSSLLQEDCKEGGEACTVTMRYGAHLPRLLLLFLFVNRECCVRALEN